MKKKSSEYFNHELALLREHGKRFAKRYPSLAPMLNGRSSDPDVERLIESAAYLTAILKEKLDGDLPEVINELTDILFPHFSRDIPSSTIIQFSPNTLLKETITIKKNSTVSSRAIEGTRCNYSTTRDIKIYPLKILQVTRRDASGKPTEIIISFELNGITISDLDIDQIHLYLSGEHKEALELYFLLLKKINKIILRNSNDQKQSVQLGYQHIKPVGFSSKDTLLPYPSNTFPGYRILQEYFHCPDKFLFVDITGFDKWKNRGQGFHFDIIFVLKENEKPSFKINEDDFSLFAVPAINIFKHEADPIRLDHKNSEYLVRPSGREPSHYNVYTIRNVKGFTKGSANQIIYQPFQMFLHQNAAEKGYTYQTKQKKSPLNKTVDTYISVAYPPGKSIEIATISLEILCTNGHLANRLNKNEITYTTGSTPEYVSFKNITTPTGNIDSPAGDNLLWKFISHLSLNYISISNADNFQQILNLYNLESVRDRSVFLANQKRIHGIRALSSTPSDRLVQGVLMRGRKLELEIKSENFSGTGDMFLFCSILDYFLGIYASLNSFTHLIAFDLSTGEKFKWPARIGEKFLI